jgi:hypothetical protein
MFDRHVEEYRSSPECRLVGQLVIATGGHRGGGSDGPYLGPELASRFGDSVIRFACCGEDGRRDPGDYGLVFAVDVDLDGDSRAERAVVGVYETTRGEIGRFLVILGRPSGGTRWTKRALFSVKDSAPF